MKHLLALMLVIVVLTAVACDAGTTPSPPPSEIGQTAVPTPVSSLIEGFIWQTDGQFGYRILRPANWRAVNLGNARGYMHPGLQDTDDRISLHIVNLQTLDTTKSQSTGMNATLFLFEENPSLEAWTAGIERMWDSDNLQFTLLDELPQAKIYSVETPDFPPRTDRGLCSRPRSTARYRYDCFWHLC